MCHLNPFSFMVEKSSKVLYNVCMITVNKILQEAKNLPDDQRLTLAHRLLMLGEPQFSKNIENSWDSEIRERMARYDRGEIQTRPVKDVFADIDRKLRNES